MKINFKIITGFVLIITVILSFFTVPVMADVDKLTVDYSLNISENSLEIRGDVLSAKGSIPMTLILSKDGKKLAVNQIVTGPSNEGVVNYEFPDIPFPPTMSSGDYKIYVSAAYLNVSREVVYKYMGADIQLEFLMSVNSKISANEASSVKNVFAQYSSTLGKSAECFSGLNDNGTKKFGDLIIAGGSYEVPSGIPGVPGSFIDSDAKIAVVSESFKKLSEFYSIAYTIAKATEVSTKTACADYIAEYGDIISITTDEVGTDYDETVMEKYLKEALAFEDVASKISASAMKVNDYAELKDAILRSGLLTLIENSRYTKIREIVEALPELFTIDKSMYNQYTDSQINNIYQQLADGKYDDIQTFIDKHNEIAYNGFYEQGGSGSSGGGSGGGWGGSVSFDHATTAPNSGNGASSVKFDDIANYAWAKEAIEQLSSKGIISGRGDGKFVPDANVTRAEFVKMVVTALNLSATYNGEFSDVDENDWYAPYVAAAKKSGIVMGDGERFNPNSNITRQDMAVMLFRAFNMEENATQKDVFYDSNLISDYAKTAVFALYEKGITRGMGNGYFAPANFATRAESAQMIFNTIK